MEPDQVFTLWETFNDDQLNELTPTMIKPMPNTYTYTKNIAEPMFKKEIGNIPHSIVRPAVGKFCI